MNKYHSLPLVRTFVCFLAFGTGAGLSPAVASLRVEQDEAAGKITVHRDGDAAAIVTQHARADFRPYLHPIVAPDGRGLLTQYSPGHHKHQTGLYWGFTRVNGRDYFHHPEGDYWRRVSADVLTPQGDEVRWRTVYDLLDEEGETVLTETQTWTMREQDGEYLLDLQWTGKANVDVTIGKYEYGGLFLRMPWHHGIEGAAVNAVRQRNGRAEGQRAPWLDVGMQVEGRDDLAHIAIFDHPWNADFPQPWRVDGQLGVGPVRARLGDWHIHAGEEAAIRHRLLVYTGALDDIEVTQKWLAYSGMESDSFMWRLAQSEAKQAEFLTPEQAVANMTLPPGFDVNVFAAEPTIKQPMAFCWDDRGRLWVVENLDYESRGHGFSASGESRVLILEDTDRDGVADSRKVFLENIILPTCIAVGFDGIWLGAPPNLLFIPDRDHDDKADVEDIEVRLTGWGIRDRHETVNSLHWGPDGWLYGCQGLFTESLVGKPAGKGRLMKKGEDFPDDIAYADEPVEINGGVWRYHPTKQRFEVVAHGFSNPWGIDYDAKGQIFISACVIPHLWHVIPGGTYHRQSDTHFNPYVYSDIRTIADHRHRSAHGGARVYLADAFPPEYHGRIFMANIHEHAVLTDILEPQGSGYVGRHGDDFLMANNAQWIGFSMEIGPAGDVYVLDWHDADICGNSVMPEHTGRIFRMAPRNSLANDWEGRFSDIAAMSDGQLVSLQRSQSAWHARRARLNLQTRAVAGRLAPTTHSQLREIYDNDENGDWRLRAMWALHVTGGLDETALLAALDDTDEHVRAWSIQLLCEDHDASSRALEKFVLMAKNDPSAVVRLYLASALQRVSNENRWAIARNLVTHQEDADDHNIPKMIWFGIEPMVPEDAQQAIQMANDSRLPLVARHIVRRLVDDDQLGAVIAGIATANDARIPMLFGLRDGLEGRDDLSTPDGWDALRNKFESGDDKEAARVVLELSQQFGDREAAEKILSTLVDPQTDTSERRRALAALASRQFEGLKPHLFELLEDSALRRDAIRAIAAFNDEELSDALVEMYHDFNTDEKLDAVHTLAARTDSAWKLFGALYDDHIPKRDVPAYVARQMRRVIGTKFVDYWGPLESLPEGVAADFAKYRALLTDEAVKAADASRGRGVFRRTCAACHKMYEEGGLIGPDITGANRANLDYLLGNVLTPSADIQDAYRMVLILNDEGRLHSGVLADENERQVRLRVPSEDEPVIISKSAILSREVAPVSMMPEGLLNNLTSREVLDLVAYLRTTSQVPLSESP